MSIEGVSCGHFVSFLRSHVLLIRYVDKSFTSLLQLYKRHCVVSTSVANGAELASVDLERHGHSLIAVLVHLSREQRDVLALEGDLDTRAVAATPPDEEGADAEDGHAQAHDDDGCG